MKQREQSRGATALFVALVGILTFGAGMTNDAQAADFQLETFDWSTSPASATQTLKNEVDATVDRDDWRAYTRLTRTATLDGASWQHFMLFHDSELVAQGYTRKEEPQKLRFGTISDVISYDNNYGVVNALTQKFGEPHYSDKRTRRKYSQELGNAQLRSERSVDWDLRGEVFRWETDVGTVRYSVQYSLKGEKSHRLVQVNPDATDAYFDYTVARAFRDAGVELIRQYERRAKKVVVAVVSSSGATVKAKVTVPDGKIVAVEPKRKSYTRTNCEVAGQPCKVTYKTYGGRIYETKIEFTKEGQIGRRSRGGYEKAGEAAYEHFTHVNKRLRKMMGEPTFDKRVTDLDNNREKRKIHRLPQGMEAFWTVWYTPQRDIISRHVVTGESTGVGFRVDETVTFRMHSVSRAFTEQDAWDAEHKEAKKVAAKRKAAEKAKNENASTEED